MTSDPSASVGPTVPLGLSGEIVYVLRDYNDDVLYVGVTAHFKNRMKHHRYTKPWWHDVAVIETTEWGDDWKGAEEHERSVISELTPLHNSPNAWGTGRRNWDI